MNSPISVLFTILLAVLGPSAALAQAYPAKPIHIVVGFLPGGGSDTVGRLLAQALSERLGQTVLVENRPGAGGTIATESVVRSTPDGYTLLLGSPSEITINPELYSRLTFDPRKDLVPVAIFASTPLVLVVHPSLPVKSVKDLIALAKGRPGEINYGSAGTGSMTHLAAAILVSNAGINVIHIPYKGLSAALSELVGGHVHMVCAALPGAIGLIQAGRLRPLGVTTSARAKALPEVPTLSEAGVKDYEVTQWYGPFAPVATPREVIHRLHDEIGLALRSPDTVARIALQGAEPVSMTQEQLAYLLKNETVKWTKAVRNSGAKLD